MLGAKGLGGITYCPTTSRRWFCLPSTLAHLRRFEPANSVSSDPYDLPEQRGSFDPLVTGACLSDIRLNQVPAHDYVCTPLV